MGFPTTLKLAPQLETNREKLDFQLSNDIIMLRGCSDDELSAAAAKLLGHKPDDIF